MNNFSCPPNPLDSSMSYKIVSSAWVIEKEKCGKEKHREVKVGYQNSILKLIGEKINPIPPGNWGIASWQYFVAY